MIYAEQKRAVVTALLPLCPVVLIDGLYPGAELPTPMRRADLTVRLSPQGSAHIFLVPTLFPIGFTFAYRIDTDPQLHHGMIPWDAVCRLQIIEPFSGPLIIWPLLPQAEESPKPALSLVQP